MNRKQESLAFGLSGLLFGILIGYLIAFQIHAPRVRADLVAVSSNPSGGASMSAQMDPMGEDHITQITDHIQHLQEEAAANPQNPGPLMELGSIYLQVFKFQEASEYFEKALAIDPQNLDVRTNLGICWLRLEKSSEARTLFARSVEIDPDHWESWMYLGVIALSRDHDIKTAEHAFDEVNRIHPGLPEMKELRLELEKIRTQHAAGS